MSEVKTEVTVYQVKFLCEYCGIGEMKPTGMSYPSYPPSYLHACDHCGAKEALLSRYPKITYETSK